MTISIRTVKDLLVDAVRLDRGSHTHVGPVRASAWPFVVTHDFKDMAGWGRTPGDRKCQLDRDDGDPYAAIRRAFWEQYDREPTPDEISRADRVLGWIMLVDDEKDRRALIGWLHSKAGGKAFRRWCKQIEGISQPTGLKRKNRALEKIFLSLGRSDAPHNIFGPMGGLPFAGDFSDLSATIAAGAHEGIDHWSAPDAEPDITNVHYESPRSGNREVAVPQSEFTWAEKQNARRRQREAARRKKMAESV